MDERCPVDEREITMESKGGNGGAISRASLQTVDLTVAMP